MIYSTVTKIKKSWRKSALSRPKSSPDCTGGVWRSPVWRLSHSVHFYGWCVATRWPCWPGLAPAWAPRLGGVLWGLRPPGSACTPQRLGRNCQTMLSLGSAMPFCVFFSFAYWNVPFLPFARLISVDVRIFCSRIGWELIVEFCDSIAQILQKRRLFALIQCEKCLSWVF